MSCEVVSVCCERVDILKLKVTTPSPSLLSRLALPVCLNYLYMIQVVRLVHHDDDKVPETAFAYVSRYIAFNSPIHNAVSPWCAQLSPR